MEIKSATQAFAALSQETRLQVFRELIRCGQEEISAGDLATRLEVSPSTLSFHLKELERAELVRARRDGRFILYAANHEGIRSMIDFLVADCCQGDARLCGPYSAGFCDETADQPISTGI